MRDYPEKKCVYVLFGFLHLVEKPLFEYQEKYLYACYYDIQLIQKIEDNIFVRLRRCY